MSADPGHQWPHYLQPPRWPLPKPRGPAWAAGTDTVTYKEQGHRWVYVSKDCLTALVSLWCSRYICVSSLDLKFENASADDSFSPVSNVWSCSCVTALELTQALSIWEGVSGLWPCYLLTMTSGERFVLIPAEKWHLISPHGALFALVLETAKSLSHLFISYNELHPGFLLNKPASEIAFFISHKRFCNCVSLQLTSFSFVRGDKSVFLTPSVCVSVHRHGPSPSETSE